MSGLHEAFDEIVADVPVYGDLDRAIEQADRERRHRYGVVAGLAAAAAVLAVIVGVVAVTATTPTRLRRSRPVRRRSRPVRRRRSRSHPRPGPTPRSPPRRRTRLGMSRTP